MLRKITIMIFLILTVVWFTNSDSIQPAREFIQNNIYVWSEMQDEKLPIYCVDTQKKQIALTFDTAWGNEDIPQILKILKQENVKATFFVTDGNSDYRYLLAKEAAAGHTVAIHSATHDYKYIYSSCDAYFEDLNRMSDIITEQTGKRPKLLRFPGGSSNTISKQYCSRIMSVLTKAVSDQGYKYFDWNVSSGDAGGTTSTSEVYNNVISGIQSHDISVVLQHDIKLFIVNTFYYIIFYFITLLKSS